MVILNLCQAAGGLAVFLFGMKLCAEGLRYACGGSLKTLLTTLTRNRLLAVLAGIVVTLFLSSSSATTVLLVGLVDARLLGLRRSLAVILGSDIGTALTLQLLAFKIEGYAGALVAVGFVGQWVSRYTRPRYAFQAVLGLGLLFVGLGLVSSAMKPMMATPAWRDWLRALLANPVTGTLAAALFTALIQSSAATIMIGFAFMEGGETLVDVLPLVMGANLGTCATALIAAAGAGPRGKRVALAHVLFKLTGVVVAVPLLGALAHVTLAIGQATGTDQPARLLIHAHTLVNVALTVAFLPWLRYVKRLVKRLIPSKDPRTDGVIEFIDPKASVPPDEALARARQEVVATAHRALTLVEDIGPALESVDQNALDDALRDDDNIDLCTELITDYLVKLPDAELTDPQRRQKRMLMFCARELETIGDVVSKELVSLGRKLALDGLRFAPEDAAGLSAMHGRLVASFRHLVSHIERPHATDAGHVFQAEMEMDEHHKQLYNEHLGRLAQRESSAQATSPVFLDVVRGVRLIHTHLVDLLRAVSRAS